jgi:hypothetical protein
MALLCITAQLHRYDRFGSKTGKSRSEQMFSGLLPLKRTPICALMSTRRGLMLLARMPKICNVSASERAAVSTFIDSTQRDWWSGLRRKRSRAWLLSAKLNTFSRQVRSAASYLTDALRRNSAWRRIVQTPVEIDFQGMSGTPEVHTSIEKHVAELEQRYGRVTACRVVLKGPGGHHRTGGLL